MNRRDFLFFKREPARRIAELSCEQLYMRVVDTQLVSARTGGLPGDEPLDGEPPAVFDTRTRRGSRACGGRRMARFAGTEGTSRVGPSNLSRCRRVRRMTVS